MTLQLATTEDRSLLSNPDARPRDAERAERLADPALHELLLGYARTRVPEADAEDVVQTVLCAALASTRLPDDAQELRRWLVGVARHKVADVHRQRARLRSGAAPAQAAEAVDEASEWLLWVEKQLDGDRQAARTLAWMARESEGEKLAHIAASETVPAPQLRQRVSRLRRLLKHRWAAEAALISMLLVAVLVAWRVVGHPRPHAMPVLDHQLSPPPTSPTDPRAMAVLELRVEAVAACDAGRWQACLELLDASVELAPESADLPIVQLTRARAQQALEWQRVEEHLERTPIRDYKTGP